MDWIATCLMINTPTGNLLFLTKDGKEPKHIKQLTDLPRARPTSNMLSSVYVVCVGHSIFCIFFAIFSELW